MARSQAAWCLLLAATLTCARAAVASGQASTDPPPLPLLAADAFPEASRATIVVAWRDAQERPTDARAVGRLAMLLQAWEQFDIAAIVYKRAQALAPGDADWWYLGASPTTRAPCLHWQRGSSPGPQRSRRPGSAS